MSPRVDCALGSSTVGLPDSRLVLDPPSSDVVLGAPGSVLVLSAPGSGLVLGAPGSGPVLGAPGIVVSTGLSWFPGNFVPGRSALPVVSTGSCPLAVRSAAPAVAVPAVVFIGSIAGGLVIPSVIRVGLAPSGTAP